MTVASEITRLQTAKADIKTSIENKGVQVPSNITIDLYPQYIDNIYTGNPYTGTLCMRCWLTRWLRSGYRSWISCMTSFAYNDYIFRVVAGASYNSSYDEYHINYFALKDGWTDYKMIAATTTTADDWYAWNAWYVVDGTTLTILCNCSNSKGASYRYWANFNLSTGAWINVWQSSTIFTTHWNDIFSSCQFDPAVYNFYWTEEPLVILNWKTS